MVMMIYFTGHEKESDLAEGIYTTEYRLYDARVGRWLSVDPLSMDNAGESPYLYCSGMPMTYFDPDGRVKRDKNGEVIFIEEKSDDWFLSQFLKKTDKGYEYSAFKAIRGYIQLNNGTRVTAYKVAKDAELRKIMVNNSGEVLHETDYITYDKIDISYNCTGKIADKQFNIYSDVFSLDELVSGEGYTPISVEEAKPGDIGIYYTEGKSNHKKRIIHFESVDPDGTIDTKGGSEFREIEQDKKNKLGQDYYFLHIYEDPAYESPDDYEVKYQLYRPKETK